MAKDSHLSRYEKIGFPNSLREGFEEAIFDDLATKLPRLKGQGGTVVDIGCGCSGLPNLLIRNSDLLRQRLILVDSEEMLALLPDSPGTMKRPGYFPNEELLDEFGGSADCVLSYSVIQYVFAEAALEPFIDGVLHLLAPGGHALIGDIPNSTMRTRFLASDAGKAFHRRYMGVDSDPKPLSVGAPQSDEIDDTVVLGLLARARAAGFHAFVMPQPEALPMANRREDVLLVRP